MNELLSDYRKEKASEFLTYWAFRLYQNKPIIEQAFHFFTGGNQMTDAGLLVEKRKTPLTEVTLEDEDGVLVTKRVVAIGFTHQMTAKQDRNPGHSKPILGGVMQSETHERRALSIDQVLLAQFTPRQRLLSYYLFLPKALYKIEGLTDKRISKAAGICPKRACEIKFKAIHLVDKEVLGPKGE